MPLPPGLNTFQIAGILANYASSAGEAVKNLAIKAVSSWQGQPIPEHDLNLALANALALLDTARTWVSHCHESAIAGLAPPQKQERLVGMNVSAIVNYGNNVCFSDVMRMHDAWISQGNGPSGLGKAGAWDDTTNPIAINSEGYPTVLGPTTDGPYQQVALTLLMHDSNGGFPAGAYTLLWEGAATWAIRQGGGVLSNTTPGRAVLTLAEPINGGIGLALTSMDPANPLRNLRLILPGMEFTYQTQPFNPAWLAMNAPFSWLRTMDWQRTNNSPLTHWADSESETRLGYGTAKGVPPKFLVDLSKATGKPVWVCIPHLATDAYVTSFATYLRDGNPGARWMVEYTNECWNGQFQQAQYAVAQAQAAGIPGPEFTASQNWYARRARQVFQIFSVVFGQGYASQIERVLSGQNTGAESANMILPFESAHLSATHWSTAPYFGSFLINEASWAATLANLSAAQVVEQCRAQVAGTAGGNLPGVVAASAAAAATYNLKYVTYEGGNHAFNLVGQAANLELTALLTAADSMGTMGNCYTEYLQMLDDNGCTALTHYHDCQKSSNFGSWGAKRYITQTDAVKYNALVGWVQQSFSAQTAALYHDSQNARTTGMEAFIRRTRNV